MKILATLTGSDSQSLGQAIGLGQGENEAVEAVLHSGERFANREQVSILWQSVRETLAEADVTDTIEIDWEECGWTVHVSW